MNCFRFIHAAQLSKLRLFALAAVLLALGNQHLDAQVGGDNPTGVAGAFNGQITTGCSYDAYTGNATRSVTDIAVAGGVGEYPLSLVRTANSRGVGRLNTFGLAGHWNHNYNWIIEDSASSTNSGFTPSSYTVDFPDGRVDTFKQVSSSWDTKWRVVNTSGVSLGVRERFQPMDSQKIADLLLPDGGRIEFKGTLKSFQKNNVTYWYYTYLAQAIYDPYGLKTTLARDTNDGTLLTVTEPAGGCYLQFSYTTISGTKVIQYVKEFINGSLQRTVQYNYSTINPSNQQSYVALNSVSYFSQWTASYSYCVPNIPPTSGVPLLYTCDDPMYSGPMHKIAYIYRTNTNGDGSTPAYGQIQSENYYNGTVGAAVSTLAVTGASTRQETRGDLKTRSLTYGTATNSGFLMSWTDFMGYGASEDYDGYKYIAYVIDRNSHRTDFTNDPVTGNVLQVQFPLTQGDTPGQTTRPTINYGYTNNYYLHTIQGENSQFTTITPDPSSNRITRIDYPDGAYETFTYDAAHFYQLSSHRMTTGGTEALAYDTMHRLQYYSDPYHSNPGNPSIQYSYDLLDRVSDVTDALNQTTSFTNNGRGQVLMTTLPPDPSDGNRHTIVNFYNNDGTLAWMMDQLAHVTYYTYDDYRRIKSVTPPVRGYGDNGQHITHFYYDVNGVADDYRFTDSKVTWVVLPSGKKTNIVYDDNRRKNSVIVGCGTPDAATTSYGYDSVGNVTSVVAPNEQPGQQYAGQSAQIAYDQRNRRSSTTDTLNHITSFTYDTAGHKKSVARPNGQMITYDTFDTMNRVTQQTATQSPDPPAVTKYSYYTPADGANAPVGLLKTMQDPRLVSTWSTDSYTYSYDSMGRKTQLQYPLDSYNVHRTEQWSYDTVGRLQTFTNRNGKIQTFGYDALNRMTGFTWNDGGITPSVSVGYDAASRVTSVNNPNANITRAYYNDNRLQSEVEQILLNGGTSKTVSYTYDADGNRAGMTYPDNSYSFTYGYTGRNQVNSIVGVATYGYDLNGNMISRELSPRGSGSFSYDALDRVNHIDYSFLISGDGYGDDPQPTPTPRPPPTWQSRTFDYDYDSVGNRKWMKREDNSGDVFGYDLTDQLMSGWLDIMNPDTTSPGDQSMFYDWSGNRTTFQPYSSTDLYAVNNLNQYTSRTSSDSPAARATPTPRGRPTPRPTATPTGTPTASPTPPGVQQTATYDYNGNMTIGFDGSMYVHDAQNRLLSANKNGTFLTFKYDGLNRQVSRDAPPPPDGPGHGPTFSVWDGWNLIEEYQSGNSVTGRYLYGPGGIVKNLTNNNCYFQDGSGSTSYLADSNGNLLEFYLYDFQGTPVFYDQNGYPLSTSAYGVRHLFTGQQWYQELGLYDLRNRFYSPDIGRFLQPDPIGFWGGNNLYRYCRNNPVKWGDPLGFDIWNLKIDGSGSNGGTADAEGVVVTGSDLPPGDDGPPDLDPTQFGLSPFGFEGSGVPGGSDNPEKMRELAQLNETLDRMDHQSSVQDSTASNVPSNVPSQNPPTPANSADPNADAIVAELESGADVAGAVAGVVENALSGGGDYWLSKRGYYSQEFHGNQYVGGYRGVTKGIRVARNVGLLLYGAQFVLAGADLSQNPSPANFVHQTLNLGVGALAFTGPLGFAGATMYVIIDETVGWPAMINAMGGPPTILVGPFGPGF